MRWVLAAWLLVLLAGCHPPEQPPVPPKPTDPTNSRARSTAEVAEIIDASIVGEASAPGDAAGLELDSGMPLQARTADLPKSAAAGGLDQSQRSVARPQPAREKSP
jgi:hypothetical protein